MPREEIFKKFKEGKLKSGSGAPVTDKKQAVAIAMKYGSMKGLSEAPPRKAEGYMHNVRGSNGPGYSMGSSASKMVSSGKRGNIGGDVQKPIHNDRTSVKSKKKVTPTKH